MLDASYWSEAAPPLLIGRPWETRAAIGRLGETPTADWLVVPEAPSISGVDGQMVLMLR